MNAELQQAIEILNRYCMEQEDCLNCKFYRFGAIYYNVKEPAGCPIECICEALKN